MSILLISLLMAKSTIQSGEPKLQSVPFTQVQISDTFWSPRQKTNREVSLPHSLDMLEAAGNIKNLDLAIEGKHTDYSGPVFMDSDLYKVIEAVSFSLATHPDATLDTRLDGIIAKIAKAQMADGYLDTWYQVNEPDKRFTNLRDNHEMYCGGHLIEAAVAHYQATGKRTLLNVAIKLADNLDRVFGEGPGKRAGYCGHPEIELALIKLWKATGEERYFKLAEFFVSHRGEHFFAKEHGTATERYDGTYWLDQVPIRQQTAIVGHAVRAGYLLSGVTDVMAEDGDPGLKQMIDRVWNNATQRRMYVTGGIGTSGSNEGFTTDYDLPNFTAYQETCASVAMAMWNERLALLYGDAKYVDVMERTLYNGVLAGGSADGTKYFYDNPLASKGAHHRSGWFSCACCPPNEARTLASIGGYAYGVSANDLYVNLFMQGSMKAKVGGQEIALDVKTQYPWDGKVVFDVKQGGTFNLRLRKPEWCPEASVKVNGETLTPSLEKGYLVLNRAWKAGDTIDYAMDMPVRRLEADPRVKDDQGRLALARGPLIYCMEAADNPGGVLNVALPADARLTTQLDKSILGGLVTINGTGTCRTETDWPGGLYRPHEELKSVKIKAIPYYAWDNRAVGEMQVWIPTAPPVSVARGPEGRAKVSVSYLSSNAQPNGVNDGVEPKSSGEQPSELCHWWPHKGGDEWVQYTWSKPLVSSGARVYFFDDTGRGECRLPSDWHLEYLDGGAWKPVAHSGAYPIQMSHWCEVHFSPITTTALRLTVTMQPGWAAGVRQWQVISGD
jgi:DUF1680 family protein